MNIKRKKSRSFNTLQQVIACLRVLVTFLIIVLINIVQKKIQFLSYTRLREDMCYPLYFENLALSCTFFI